MTYVNKGRSNALEGGESSSTPSTITPSSSSSDTDDGDDDDDDDDEEEDEDWDSGRCQLIGVVLSQMYFWLSLFKLFPWLSSFSLLCSFLPGVHATR